MKNIRRYIYKLNLHRLLLYSLIFSLGVSMMGGCNDVEANSGAEAPGGSNEDVGALTTTEETIEQQQEQEEASGSITAKRRKVIISTSKLPCSSSAPNYEKRKNFEQIFNGVVKLLALKDEEMKSLLVLNEEKYNFDKLKNGLEDFKKFMQEIKKAKSRSEIDELFREADESVDFASLPLNDRKEINLSLAYRSSDVYIKLKSNTTLNADGRWCEFETFRSPKDVLYANISPYIGNLGKEDPHHGAQKWGQFVTLFSQIDSFTQKFKEYLQPRHLEKIEDISPFLKLKLSNYAMVERHLEQEYIPKGNGFQLAAEVQSKEQVLPTISFILDIAKEDQKQFQKIARLSGLEGFGFVIPSFVPAWNKFVKKDYVDHPTKHTLESVALYSSAHIPESELYSHIIEDM